MQISYKNIWTKRYLDRVKKERPYALPDDESWKRRIEFISGIENKLWLRLAWALECWAACDTRLAKDNLNCLLEKFEYMNRNGLFNRYENAALSYPYNLAISHVYCRWAEALLDKVPNVDHLIEATRLLPVYQDTLIDCINEVPDSPDDNITFFQEWELCQFLQLYTCLASNEAVQWQAAVERGKSQKKYNWLASEISLLGTHYLPEQLDWKRRCQSFANFWSNPDTSRSKNEFGPDDPRALQVFSWGLIISLCFSELLYVANAEKPDWSKVIGNWTG